MYPRLKLLWELLSTNGVIFISIDDNEYHNLRMAMDEIAGGAALISTFVWKRRQTTDSRNVDNVSVDHEYVLCYAKGQIRFSGSPKDLTKYSNPDNDPRGPWMSADMTGLATRERRPNLHYDIVDPKTGNVYKPKGNRV